MDCGHDACRCQVSEGQTFCSEHCEQAAQEPPGGTMSACECGHPACLAM